MYMTNKPNGEPFYPVTVAEAVLVSEGETLAAVLKRLEQRIEIGRASCRERA